MQNACGYSSESTQCELFNEYQYDRGLDIFQKSLCPCALDERSLSLISVHMQMDGLVFR